MKRILSSLCLLTVLGCSENGRNVSDSKLVRQDQSGAPPISVAPASEPSPGEVISNAELRKRLTPEQFRVTCEKGTELAFRNEYWNNKRDGVYRCVVCDEPLFDSTTKFDSGTGWPSFFKPIQKDAVAEKTDFSLPRMRTEVVCKKCNAHLGHVFDDGPNPTGMRYCMNSAALQFIPRSAEKSANTNPTTQSDKQVPAQSTP